MKRFIVTEEQLELFRKCMSMTATPQYAASHMDDCCKIQVPNWATHFAHVTIGTDGHRGDWYVLEKCQDIPTDPSEPEQILEIDD